MCTAEHVNIIGKAHLPTVVEFLSNSFEEFSELTEDEKVYYSYQDTNNVSGS